MTDIENLEQSSNQTLSEHLKQQSAFMNMAVMAAPAGLQRDQVLDRALALLKLADIPEIALPDWYNDVRALYSISANSGGGDHILKAFRENGNPPLALVANLTKLEPK